MSLFHDIRETIRAADPAERREAMIWGPVAMALLGANMLGLAVLLPC